VFVRIAGAVEITLRSTLYLRHQHHGAVKHPRDRVFYPGRHPIWRSVSQIIGRSKINGSIRIHCRSMHGYRRRAKQRVACDSIIMKCVLISSITHKKSQMNERFDKSTHPRESFSTFCLLLRSPRICACFLQTHMSMKCMICMVIFANYCLTGSFRIAWFIFVFMYIYIFLNLCSCILN